MRLLEVGGLRDCGVAFERAVYVPVRVRCVPIGVEFVCRRDGVRDHADVVRERRLDVLACPVLVERVCDEGRSGVACACIWGDQVVVDEIDLGVPFGQRVYLGAQLFGGLRVICRGLGQGG